MKPLRKLVAKFQAAKSKLVFSHHKRGIFCEAKTFLLQWDSAHFLGGYLYRLVDGKVQPVAFVSKSFSGPQLRWPTIQKEAYAVF